MSSEPPPPPYLTAQQAARELGITPASLYAYVSRGLIRSEPQPGSRSRRYRADDVRALKRQRPPAGRAAEGETPAVESAISTLADDGPVYRGVRALPLAEVASLEQAATLLWGADAADPFAPDNLPPLTPLLRQVLAVAAAAPPVARAAAVLALANEADPGAFHRSARGRAQLAGRVLRLLAAAILGRLPEARPLHRQVAAAWAPGLPAAEELLRRALVLLADHELNASTYTVRCAASTGITLYDACVAGLVALKGPQHGGAGPLAAQLLAALDGGGDLAAGVRQRVALGERFPGFGHPLYEAGDPRAAALLAAIAAAGLGGRLARELPALVLEATGLSPNIDFALAVLTRALGLPPGHEIQLFAIARAAGWLAHAIEQQAEGRLIRPRARYTGPLPGRAGG